MAQGDQQRFCLRRNDFQTNMVSSFKLEGPSKKTSYHIPHLIQYTVCQYTTKKHDMQPTHPIRLSLALNFSVFYHKTLNFSIFYYKMLNSLEKFANSPRLPGRNTSLPSTTVAAKAAYPKYLASSIAWHRPSWGGGM